jgi:hypothetical protein
VIERQLRPCQAGKLTIGPIADLEQAMEAGIVPAARVDGDRIPSETHGLAPRARPFEAADAREDGPVQGRLLFGARWSRVHATVKPARLRPTAR